MFPEPRSVREVFAGSTYGHPVTSLDSRKLLKLWTMLESGTGTLIHTVGGHRCEFSSLYSAPEERVSGRRLTDLSRRSWLKVVAPGFQSIGFSRGTRASIVSSPLQRATKMPSITALLSPRSKRAANFGMLVSPGSKPAATDLKPASLARRAGQASPHVARVRCHRSFLQRRRPRSRTFFTIMVRFSTSSLTSTTSTERSFSSREHSFSSREHSGDAWERTRIG